MSKSEGNKTGIVIKLEENDEKERNAYSRISIFKDDVENDIPNSQIRNTLQFRKTGEDSYLYYSHSRRLYRINIETLQVEECDERKNYLRFFVLSPYSETVFSLFRKDLRGFNLFSDEQVIGAASCKGGYQYNCVCFTKDEKRMITVGQTLLICLYSLRKNEDNSWVKNTIPKLLHEYDMKNYGNHVTISKNEKFVAAVTDRRGGYIFNFDRKKDELIRIVNNYSTSSSRRRIGQSNFCDFNSDSSRCVICSGLTLTIYSLVADQTARIEVIIDLSISDNTKINDGYLKNFGGAGISSLAKYSPTNPNLLVFTRTGYGNSYTERRDTLLVFRHERRRYCTGDQEEEGEEKNHGKILTLLNHPMYLKMKNNKNKEIIATDRSDKEEKEVLVDPKEEEEEEEHGIIRRRFRRHSRSNLSLQGFTFDEDGKNVYLSRDPSEFIKIELDPIYSNREEGKKHEMYMSDLKERIEFIFFRSIEEEEGENYFSECKKCRVGNICNIFSVFLLV